MKHALECLYAPSLLESLESRTLLSATQLEFIGAVTDNVNGVSGLNGAYDVCISPDGKSVYASGLYGNSISVFDRDTFTGALKFHMSWANRPGFPTGLQFAKAVTISLDGKNVYAVGAMDNSLVAFDRDASTGGISNPVVFTDGVNGVSGLQFANDVKVSPDGRNVYVAGMSSNAIAIFDRSAADGHLTYHGKIVGTPDGTHGLIGISGVTVSPDNTYVYAAGLNYDDIAVYSRNVYTGDLTFNSRVRNNSNGVTGIGYTYCTAMSQDHKFLYAAGYDDDSIAVFSRQADGSLAFVQSYKNNVGGITGLDGVDDLAVSLDGSTLYSTAQYGNAVDVFARDPVTGLLTQSSTFVDGTGSTTKLAGASGIAASDDGVSVYAGAIDDDSVTAFTTQQTQAIVLDSAHPTLQFADHDGTKVTITRNLDTTTVSLKGWDMSVTESGKSYVVTGDISMISKIDIGGSNPKRAVTIKCVGGDGPGVFLGDVTGDGIIAKFAAKDVDMVGTGLVLSPGSAIVNLALRSVSHLGIVNMPSADVKGLTMWFGVLASQVNIVTNSPIKTLTIGSAGSGEIDVPWVGTVKTFTDKNVYGSNGNLGTSFVFYSVNSKGLALTSMKVAGAANCSLVAQNKVIGSISADSWPEGNIEALRVNSMSIKNNLGKMTMDLSQVPDAKLPALGKLTVGGWLSHSQVLSQGNIRSIKVGGLDTVSVLAAVDPNVVGLPNPATDFTGVAKIASLMVTGKVGDGAYSTKASNIAAATIGTVAFNNPKFDNGGTAWGLVSTTHGKVTCKINSKTFQWTAVEDTIDMQVLP